MCPTDGEGKMHRAAQRGRVAVALEQLRLYADRVLRDLSSKGFVTSCKCREKSTARIAVKNGRS
jgi:hypothetical protein